MKNQNYMLKEYMLPFERLDADIDQMLIDGQITRKTNGFFTSARTTQQFSLAAAVNIGYNWREITKQFLFTVLTGLGVFSEKIRELDEPPYHLMHVLQSGVAVISDDLSNVFPTLNQVAPKGPAGSHFQWWEDSIVNVVLEKMNGQNVPVKSISPGVQKLLDFMIVLSKDPQGAAVQLRIVEAIALDIALAFRYVYSSLECNGEKVFDKLKDLDWINAHIKAEAVHHRQVKDEEGGMAYIAETPEEQRKFIVLTKEYIECWSAALSDFEYFIKNESNVISLLEKTKTKVEGTVMLAANDEKIQQQWRCTICDLIYDEALGLPEDGIPAGTKFEDIPDDWICPDCGVGKDDFILV